MNKRMIFFVFLIIFMSLPQHCFAKEESYNVVFEQYTEIWHHSGGYWTGNIPRTVWDDELPSLINHIHASEIFSEIIDMNITLIKPLPAAIKDHLLSNGCTKDINVQIVFGYDRSEECLFLENSFHYLIDACQLEIHVSFIPLFLLNTSTSFYKDYPIPAPRHPSDYIKFGRSTL